MTVRLPALIDCHVHFREPGYEHKADMRSEAAAAVAGGVQAVCEMPNTNPPTTTFAAFRDKARRAERIPDLDIRFFFGITRMEHLDELRSLWADVLLRRRCCGVKVFFDHSTGNQGADAEVIVETFRACAALGIPVVGHCEDAQVNAAAAKAVTDVSGIAAHSLMRPPESEARAIGHAISLVRKHGTQFHIAHLSTERGVALVAQAKEEELPVTCEAAPHHLFLTTEDYAALGTLAKMNPPLRTPEHRQALWRGIADGTIDCIATDHAPHTLEEKRAGDPLKAPSGVPGVETLLPLLFSVAAGRWPHPTSHFSPPRFAATDITRLCFVNPNAIFRLGIPEEKWVEIDPDAARIIRGSELHSKCGWTPYEGWTVQGAIKSA